MTDRVYFPPLEQCLTGENNLLSWKHVASALASGSADRLTCPAIAHFLQDPHVHQLFKAPSTVFEAPTPQSKAAFETKTAAINVTPAPNGQHDIRTIKEDAQWLSKNARLNEVAALRVVVVALHAAPDAHLAGPLSTQDVVSLQEAAGASSGQAAAVLGYVDVSAAVDAESIWADFDKPETRRRRLLSTYLSERRSFAAAADLLVSFLLQTNPPNGTGALRQAVLKSAFGSDEVTGGLGVAAFEALVPVYLECLPGCLETSQELLPSVDAQVTTPDLETDWMRSFLAETVHVLTLVFQCLDLAGQLFASPDVVSQWFTSMAKYGFFDQLQFTDESVSELLLPLRSLACVISLQLLNPTKSMAYLDQEADLQENEDPYLSSPELLTTIHNLVVNAADAGIVSASPVILAWSLILHRMYVGYQERAERRDLAQNQRAQAGFELERQPQGGRRNSAGSIVSIEKSAYDVFLVTSSLDRDVQLAKQLALAVMTGGVVYDFISAAALCLGSHRHAALRPLVGSRARLVLMHLLRESFSAAGYQSEPVTALLSVLSGGQQYRDVGENDDDDAVPAATLRDPVLLESYIYQSLHRYPYEFLPFTSFCRVLASTLRADDHHSDLLLDFLLRTPSLTLSFAEGWNNYGLAREADNSNTLRLAADEDLFPAKAGRRRPLAEEESFRIPAGTYGRFVSDRDKIVLLEYEHSTLALLGRRLQVSTATDAYDAGPLGFLRVEERAEAIDLLATLLKAASSTTPEAGLRILREASRALPRTKDIISVVCDTLDAAIQDELPDSEGADLAVVSSALQFLHAALPLAPGRVWSYMTRCELLNTESRAGRLAGITGNLDMLAERYELLLSSLHLFAGLVQSAMSSSVRRKAATTPKPAGRQKAAVSSDLDAWLGTSDKILARICLSIAQVAVDMYENSATWRFASEVHRSTVVSGAVGIMNDLLVFSFAVAPPDAESGRLTACLRPAAEYVVDGFLAASSGTLRFQPILASLLASFQIPDSSLYPQREDALVARLAVVSRFATTLLRVADYLDRPPAPALRTQLFKTASLACRLYAVRDAFRLPALALLGALIESAGKGDASSEQPPSLLGYVGPQLSWSFIRVLSRLDRPLDRLPATAAVWAFFSAVVRNRQQWMANCLLTGKMPRDALNNHDGSIARLAPDSSVLHAALRRLASVAAMPSRETLAVMDFVVSAQNYWPWTILAMQRDGSATTFLGHLRAYVRDLRPAAVVARSSSSDDPAEAAYQARIASLAAETLAMHLYHLRQTGRDDGFARDLVADLDYFLRDGVLVAGYNTSLHVNFARNFAARYPAASSLDDFRSTLLEPRRSSDPPCFYALDYADAMLGFDAGWVGPRQNGFRREMETANLNLGLVDSQIALFHAWSYLLLELSVCLLPQNQTIAKHMLQVAEKCLEANQSAQGPQDIFVRLSQARADLALSLLQRLADASLLPRDTSHLLTTVSAALASVENPFGRDQIRYDRSLLKILYVVLRGSASTRPTAGKEPEKKNPGSLDTAPSSLTQLVLSILDRVVAQGFRSLVTLVHEPDSPAEPQDMALVTAILQACLAVPGIGECQPRILNIMASTDVLHAASSLFSWADRLAASKGDPVYGELALLFLLELSSLPVVCEQLAAGGLLGHLTSASLAGLLRRPNVSPLAEAAGPARCYSIWAKGILPILLNMLSALGATVAPEVAFVLNQFPGLLRASIDRLEAPGVSRTTSAAAAAEPAKKAAATPTSSSSSPAPRRHHVVLLAVSEAHSLALLTRVLAALRAGNNRDIPEVAATAWDAAQLLENVEVWLSSRRVLRERLLPLGPREADWRAAPAAQGSGCENKLEEKVVAQLESLRDVLVDGLE